MMEVVSNESVFSSALEQFRGIVVRRSGPLVAIQHADQESLTHGVCALRDSSRLGLLTSTARLQRDFDEVR